MQVHLQVVLVVAILLVVHIENRESELDQLFKSAICCLLGPRIFSQHDG